MAVEYVTQPQLVAPSGAAPVSLTPSGVSLAWSSWVELIASAASDLVLTGLTVGSPGYSAAGSYFQIGVGAAGAETAVATLTGFGSYNSRHPIAWLQLPVPVSGITSGSRVAVRLAKTDTNTTAWKFALTYYAAPVTGITTTTVAPTSLPAPAGAWASISVGATPNTWSSWVELTTGLGTAIALATISGNSALGANGYYDLQIGTGAAGAESVIAQTGWLGGSSTGQGGFVCQVVQPLIEIPTSTRIAVRARSTYTFARTFTASIGYYTLPL